MDEIQIETLPPSPPAWDEHVEYPGFYKRFAAFIFDCAILLLPLSLIIDQILTIYMGPGSMSQQMIAATVSTYGEAEGMRMVLKETIARRLVEYFWLGIISGGIWVACWYYLAATPGKYVLGMRVVRRQDGQPTTLRQNIIRFIAYVPTALPLGLGFFWAQWNKRGLAWHDMIAKTVVVKKSSLPLELRDKTLHSVNNPVA